MNRLNGKVALVTGSTQGLGEGIARCFAQEGAKLVVNGRSQEKGDKVVAALRQLGAEAIFIRADLTDKAQAQQLVQRAAEHFGGLDILVNNAQVVPELASADSEVNDALLDVALHSGVYASLWTGQAALPWFIRAGGGRIINFGSLNGVYGSKFGLAYNTTKEGMRGLTRTLANEWGRHNVTVNMVLPSGVSPAYEAFYGDDLKKMEAVARQTPMRRHGRAQEDIGNAVLGLAAESGRFITGQSLFIDGGQNLLGLPQLHGLDSAKDNT
ncbi:SDR family NAD(P)-dependent oxidoreductase [Pseudomonas sp. B392_1p]|uniref:SDR family NAD(P)-dependent oxidoreductase n=1 Tax=Pseudomonas sp. B392_1p TaxID=3457507 RepID=UPI003FD49B27